MAETVHTARGALIYADTGCRFVDMGYVEDPMRLANFPFDVDELKIELRTASNFMTQDGKTSGDPGGKT